MAQIPIITPSLPCLQHPRYDRIDDQLHCKDLFAGRDDDGVRRRHERADQHFQQVAEVDVQFLRVADVDDGEALVIGRDAFGGKRVRGVDQRYALEVNVGA